MREENVLDALGLEVTRSEVQVGSTYPIFGMITQFKNDTPGEVVAEVNHNITVHLNLKDQDRVDVLKKKAFETGIFISRVLAVEPEVEVECKKVIFGKPQAYSA